MFKKILVPIDGSKAGQRALREAILIAKQIDGNVALEIIHVVPSVVYGLENEYVQPQLIISERAKQYGTALVHEAGRIASAAGIPVVTTAVLFGAAEEEIVSSARKGGSNIIIMGTHGRKGLERLTLGSVAEYVIRNAGVPVMCLRGIDDGKLDGPIDTLHTSVPLKRILFPFDNSDISKEALNKVAIPLCRTSGAELHLCYQIESSIHRFSIISECEVRVLKEKEEAEKFLEDAGKEAAKVLGKEKVFTNVMVSSQHVADGLCASANEFDLVILSTHGRRGLQRMLMGSVTESILRSCNTPVLTYHPESGKA